MKKVISILIIGVLSANFLMAQQTLNYTQFTENTLAINPAYAGSLDSFSLVGLYRAQWVGVKDAPETQTVTAHGRLNDKVGLGGSIINESYFISRKNYVNAAFSYTLNFAKSKLAFGINGGFEVLDIDTSKANGAYDIDDSFAVLNVQNNISPQFGIGIFMYGDKYFFGLSVPRVLENEHFDENSINRSNTVTSFVAKEQPTLYLMGGYIFNLTDNIEFKPATQISAISGVLGVDVSANFRFIERFRLGVNYSWDASVSALAGIKLNKAFDVGFAYDFSTTDLANSNNGSYEVFLRWNIKNRFF